MGLSTPLLLLTGLSLLLTFIIFVVTLFTFGTISVWVNIISSGLTFIYHAIVVALSWRRALHPFVSESGQISLPFAYTTTSISCACLILGVWVVAGGVGIETTVNGMEHLRSQVQYAGWNQGLQIALSILLVIETLVAGVISMYIISIRRRSRAKQIRRDDDKSLFPPSLLDETLLTGPVLEKNIRELPVPSKIEPPSAIHLKVPEPVKVRSGTGWNRATPGRPSMLKFETRFKMPGPPKANKGGISVLSPVTESGTPPEVSTNYDFLPEIPVAAKG